MGGRGSSSTSQLRKMATGGNNGGAEPSEKLLNAPWQKYTDGNKVSVGATLAQAEERIKSNTKYETGVLVDSQGFVVAAYKGGAHSVDFGNEPASLFKNATITHNHPSGYPIFSVADLATPALYAEAGGKLKSVRATSVNGTISVSTQKSNANWNKLATAYNNAMESLDVRANKAAAKAYATKVKGAGRQAYIDTYTNWLSKNAPKYGFTVDFER